MPRDIRREFLTEPTKFDEIMENLEIIINKMMADDGPVPMDLGKVGSQDAKMTRSDSDTSNDMSFDDVRAVAWKGYKAGKGTGKKGPNGLGVWHRGEGADDMTKERRKEVRRAPRAANLTGTVTGTKEVLETKANAKTRARAKSDTATNEESRAYRSALSIQVDQQHGRRRGPRLVVGK